MAGSLLFALGTLDDVYSDAHTVVPDRNQNRILMFEGCPYLSVVIDFIVILN